jgi:ketosteroid isomerase-like protein
MTMKTLFSIVVTLLVLAISGCAPQVDVEADKAAVRAALGEAWNAVIAKDVDKFVSICADEDIMFPPNAPMVRGKQGVREYMTQFFASPGYSISRQPPQIEVSGAGDLAYTWDTFELTVNDAEGNPVTQNAKHVVVWKKEPQGTWKIVADIWNSNLPAGE